jgi:hypothetical protein
VFFLDVPFYNALTRQGIFALHLRTDFEPFIFVEETARFGFIGSWNYLDVSELRGVLIHSIVGKAEAFLNQAAPNPSLSAITFAILDLPQVNRH